MKALFFHRTDDSYEPFCENRERSNDPVRFVFELRDRTTLAHK
jgi:hypothetical protein